MSETWDAWSIRKSEQAERLKAAILGLRIDNSGDYETRWLAIADRGEHVSVVVFGQTDICGRREIDATDDEVLSVFNGAELEAKVNG